MYYCMSKISREIYIFNSGYLSSRHHIYVSKDVKIRGDFSDPKGICEQESLGNNGLEGFGEQEIPFSAGIRVPDRPTP